MHGHLNIYSSLRALTKNYFVLRHNNYVLFPIKIHQPLKFSIIHVFIPIAGDPIVEDYNRMYEQRQQLSPVSYIYCTSIKLLIDFVVVGLIVSTACRLFILLISQAGTSMLGTRITLMLFQLQVYLDQFLSYRHIYNVLHFRSSNIFYSLF
jgi:hypothetical protein